MNTLNVIGRLGKDPELRYTPAGKAVASWRLAVDRAKGEQPDWFNCVAWDKLAETVTNHIAKGSKVGITGRLQTRSYEKDGRKMEITEIVCERVDFLDPRPEQNTVPDDVPI